MTEVVPLRQPGAAEPSEVAAETFADAEDAGRILMVSWPDEAHVELRIGGPEEHPVTMSLGTDDVLDLVRALVDNLPAPGCPAPAPAAVLRFPRGLRLRPRRP